MVCFGESGNQKNEGREKEGRRRGKWGGLKRPEEVGLPVCGCLFLLWNSIPEQSNQGGEKHRGPSGSFFPSLPASVRLCCPCWKMQVGPVHPRTRVRRAAHPPPGLTQGGTDVRKTLKQSHSPTWEYRQQKQSRLYTGRRALGGRRPADIWQLCGSVSVGVMAAVWLGLPSGLSGFYSLKLLTSPHHSLWNAHTKSLSTPSPA